MRFLFCTANIKLEGCMPRGASAKREREYRELKHQFKKEGRYKGREEEVASRIVNKQRAQFGETKREKQQDRQVKSPAGSTGFPIERSSRSNATKRSTR